MKCNIKYIGKLRNGTPQFFCTIHKSFASNRGIRLEECFCSNKEMFLHPLDILKTSVDSIQIVYEDIFKSLIPKIYINQKEYSGVFIYENSVLTYKDFGGILLSFLHSVSLEQVVCKHCGCKHSDNGKFAFTPHRIHFCSYCVHKFGVKEKNIGSELAFIYDIPSITLENNSVVIEERCCVSYDLFFGTVLVNNKNVNSVVIKNKSFSLVDFLSEKLNDEF